MPYSHLQLYLSAHLLPYYLLLCPIHRYSYIYPHTSRPITCCYAVFTDIAIFIRTPLALLPVAMLYSHLQLYLSAHLSPYYLSLCPIHRYSYIYPHTSRPITCCYAVFTDIAIFISTPLALLPVAMLYSHLQLYLSAHLLPYYLLLCPIHRYSYIYPHTSRPITCCYAPFTDIAIFIRTPLALLPVAMLYSQI